MTARELGAFLRARRDTLQPADFGLVPDGRRRAPGLRREEVARLANVSVDYYERLERACGTKPSETLLASLARALRLSVDERDYLYHVAGHAAPVVGAAAGPADQSMTYLLDTIDAVPAHIMDDLTTVLAQNRLDIAVFGSWADQEGRNKMLTWRWFTDPTVRSIFLPAHHEAIGRGYAADLRAVTARRRDPVVGRLVADLRAASDEFSSFWDDMQVAALRTADLRLVHPQAGRLDIQRDVLLSTTTAQRLVIARPRDGSGTDKAFALLRARRDPAHAVRGQEVMANRRPTSAHHAVGGRSG